MIPAFIALTLWYAQPEWHEFGTLEKRKGPYPTSRIFMVGEDIYQSADGKRLTKLPGNLMTPNPLTWPPKQ